MIDIRILRNEPEKLIEALKRRNETRIDVDHLLDLDKQRRELVFSVEQMKSKQNTISKQIPQLKKEGKDTAPIFAEIKVLSDYIKKIDEQVKAIDEQIETIMYTIPNIANPSVPDGDTDEDNIEVRRFMEPTQFDFEPKAHWDLGEDLGILDPATAA
ncbi:MAG: serine--tRNA ligase, partial [Clostridia bacterium]|nr:serine--tRNA ligase [Clostridia bacterium]